MNKLKFKKTKSEIEEKEINNLKRSYKKRIFVSPPRYAEFDEPITPPRKACKRDEDEEFRSKLADIADEDAEFEAYIPHRWQHQYFDSYSDNDLDDEESYAERIRAGMWGKYHPKEAEQDRESKRTRQAFSDKHKKAKQAAKEQIQSELKESVIKQSTKEAEDIENYRISFRHFWLESPDEITTENIKYPSIDKDISSESITKFLQLDIISSSEQRKLIRDLMRIFHPDKFVGKYKDRIPSTDFDQIHQNIEFIARILTHLL